MKRKSKHAAIVSTLCVLLAIPLFGCAGVSLDLSNPASSLTLPAVVEKMTVRDKYQERINYLNFSEISQKMIPQEIVGMPADLAEFLVLRSPKIADQKRFEKEFWEEAEKIGYSKNFMETADAPDVIMAIVKTVGSRMTYFNVDGSKDFKAKCGKDMLPMADTYFHLKLGDCDKYRDITIAAYAFIKNSFDDVKKRNPKLTNVYLAIERLGGIIRNHAWITVIILQKDAIILSHIDPTFYDNNGDLEGNNNYHVMSDNGVFRAYFYQALGDCDAENFLFAYDLLRKAYSQVTNKNTRAEILRTSSFGAARLAAYRYHREAVEQIDWVNDQCRTGISCPRLDIILYRSCEIYSRAGYDEKAAAYKEQLFRDHPKSFWTNQLKIMIDR